MSIEDEDCSIICICGQIIFLTVPEQDTHAIKHYGFELEK